jgi:hypothetical protein
MNLLGEDAEDETEARVMLQSWGISEELQDATLDPMHKEMRSADTLEEWVKDTMVCACLLPNSRARSISPCLAIQFFLFQPRLEVDLAVFVT